MDIYKKLIKDDLYENLLKYLINYNNSNNAPYHNFNHLITVTKHLLNAINYYKSITNMDYIENEKELIVAGLTHDANHSMGKEKDSVNIKYANDFLYEFLKLNNKLSMFDICSDFIAATQFPYVIEDKFLSFNQKLIRDCDILQCVEDNWFQVCNFGLAKELGISHIDMISNNIKFYENINFRTDYGKKYEDVIQTRIDFLNKLI